LGSALLENVLIVADGMLEEFLVLGDAQEMQNFYAIEFAATPLTVGLNGREDRI
jgi:hypothetical protein